MAVHGDKLFASTRMSKLKPATHPPRLSIQIMVSTLACSCASTVHAAGFWPVRAAGIAPHVRGRRSLRATRPILHASSADPPRRTITCSGRAACRIARCSSGSCAILRGFAQYHVLPEPQQTCAAGARAGYARRREAALAPAAVSAERAPSYIVERGTAGGIPVDMT